MESSPAKTDVLATPPYVVWLQSLTRALIDGARGCCFETCCQVRHPDGQYLYTSVSAVQLVTTDQLVYLPVIEFSYTLLLFLPSSSNWTKISA